MLPEGSVKGFVGVLLFISGAALTLSGVNMIGQASGQGGGGIVMILGFGLLVLPGVPITLTGASMAISAWRKAKKRQSKNQEDTESSESG